MKPGAQRIAIAIHLGFTGIRRLDTVGGYRLVGYLSGTWEGKPVRNERDVPDYPDSLDAMHEAEKVLEWGGTAAQFNGELLVILRNRPALNKLKDRAATAYSWHASAAQRAEAFLRTLSLWEDEP